MHATEPQPTPWCRTILTALEQHGAADRVAGHLGLLLCSLIEMDLAPDEFGRLLARYAADPRPEIAEAAGMLASLKRVIAVVIVRPTSSGLLGLGDG